MKKIKEYRLQLNLRQIDIAKELGISKVAVSKWEKGTMNPRVEHLPKLAKILKCNISDFFNYICNLKSHTLFKITIKRDDIYADLFPYVY